MVNAARNLRQLRSSPASWACVAVILGIQTAVATVPWPWIETLGLNRDAFFSGKIWQGLSYGLLHGSWVHAAVNSSFILLVGSRIEHMAGRAAVVKTLVAGILGGGIIDLLLTPAGPDTAWLVGISGGCVALLLLLTTLSPQSRMMPLPVSGKSLGFGILTAELLLALSHPALGVPLLSDFGSFLVSAGLGSWFQIGHACHFGGGVAGWLMGRWLLRPRTTLKRLHRDRERREASDLRRVD